MPLTGDSSILSNDPEFIGYDNYQRLYNHAIFKASSAHFIMLNDRVNCDDAKNDKGKRFMVESLSMLKTFLSQNPHIQHQRHNSGRKS